MNDMNGGLEAGDLPAHMDTTDDLVPTLDVRQFILDRLKSIFN